MKATKQTIQPPASRARRPASAPLPGGHCTGSALLRRDLIQAKLTVSQPDDRFEKEADRVADQVLRMPAPALTRPDTEAAPIRPLAIQRRCQECEEELQRQLQGSATESAGLDSVAATLRGTGRPLDPTTRAFFEPRFGVDFSAVRIHTGTPAAASARAVNALAYTVGRDVVFGSGQYAPHSDSGRKLLAHELTHVVQQSGAGGNRVGRNHEERDLSAIPSWPLPQRPGALQRTIGDGHDLTSRRFALIEDLEAAYDDETLISNGSSGRGVQAIQQALYDLGYPLPTAGADGRFRTETETAVKAFQRAHPPLAEDGKVGKKTMVALDAKFGAPVLPPVAARSALWTESCVRSVLCPWSPHTVDVLKTRITLKSFNDISWADEEWDGAAWVPAPFPGGGYNTGVEIGVLNSSCEEMSETLYHEVLHAEQPTGHSTTLEKESYAYRIGEEFSIAMGLHGRPSLRSTDPRGRQFADPAKIGTSLAPGGAAGYPGVPVGGGSDQIIGKAVILGEVRVRRPNGSIYTRPAAVGEKVPGPMTVINEVTHPTAGWTCP